MQHYKTSQNTYKEEQGNEMYHYFARHIRKIIKLAIISVKKNQLKSEILKIQRYVMDYIFR